MAPGVQGDAQELSGGALYIVATPIGNLDDITARALAALTEADLIAAEDTRHTRGLLGHFGIKTPLVSYYGAKEKERAADLLGRLKSGLKIALVSDAGTPGISDPGSVIVRQAVEAGIPVIPIPGPSALIAALSASGLPTEEFTFIGFLPNKDGERARKLESLALEPRTLVFYESPKRAGDTLSAMREAFGAERRAAVCRELTKIHEQIARGTLGELASAMSGESLGEHVIVVEGASRKTRGMDEALLEVAVLMGRGMGRKEAASRVAKEYGLSKSELYNLSLHDSLHDENPGK